MTSPTPAKPEEPGLVEDFVDIFVSPAKVFARRSKAGGGAAYFAVVIALIVLAFSAKNVMQPIMEAQFTKAGLAMQAKNPDMTSERVQAFVAFQMKLAPVYYVVGPPLAILGIGLMVWVIGKLFGAAITFGSSIMIASFANVPRIIGSIATDVQGLMTSDLSTLTNMSQVSLSPARFLDPATASASVLALLMRLDLMTLWGTVLIGVAYAAAGKLPKGKAAAAAVVLWLLGTLFPLWGALRGG